MSPQFREIVRFVAIGLAFGLIWAGMQYAKGEITDPAVLAGPVVMFGLAGVLMWALRRIVNYFRGR